MTVAVTVLINGLVTGAVYGLVAVGLSLVFKKSGVLNFANGESGMVGAFVFYTLLIERSWPYLAAAIIGVGAAGALGAVTYLVLAPRRDDPLLMLIGTLGVAGVLVFVAVEVWGTDPHFVPPPLTGVQLSVAGSPLTGARLLVLLFAAALAIVAWAVFRYTGVGLLFRASAGHPYAAELLGIHVTRLDVVTWAVAGALAGLAGVLIAPLIGFHVLFLSLLAVRGFAAALIAGMTNVGGSLLAGLGLGVGESALAWATQEPGLPEAILVLLIVAVLVFRPTHQLRRTA